MVMSALTVRANMKMLFDDPSANKAQAKYMNRIAQMEQGATKQTQGMNEKLLRNHRTLVSNLEKENRKADRQLLASKEEISKKVSAASRRALTAIKPPKSMMKDDPSKYKKEVARYDRAAKRMKAINKKMAMDAKQLGATGLSGGKITTTQFLKQETYIRKKILALAEAEVKAQRKGTYERKLAQRELDRFIAAQKMMNAEEDKHGKIHAKNNAAIRMSQMQLNKATAMNNRLLKERMAYLHRINAAIGSAFAQAAGTFQGALMMSGIALMSFGFKLQSVISTFMDFEKELINAQSIFQTTNDVLFSLSDEIVNFGTQYGISLGTASEGLYTLASAGLSASDSQEVLANTLKLSMAVQGDHETIAKLTTQTIFGFGLQMSESAELTDKFAHAINMSLIEYQDLASAVKFAMPFFTATGQNIDQLLGSLQVLTNRALEAGIAGRGLRQALAEFAQHAEDNTSAFRRMGVEIMNTDGSFKLLTEIAREFKDVMGPAASDVDLMTTLLEDLNVRGATAFVHLVQNAEEFEGAVDDLSNSAGAATRMADIQQQSLSNQIQVIKNALMAPFLLSDKVGTANGTMNVFGERLHEISTEFEAFFIKKLPDGTGHLTDMGIVIRDTVLVLLDDLSSMVKGLLNIFADMNTETNGLSQTLHALMLPLKATVWFLDKMGEGGLQTIIMFKLLTGILPIAQAGTVAMTMATMRQTQADAMYSMGVQQKSISMMMQADQMKINTMIQKEMVLMQMGANATMFAGLMLINKSNDAYKTLGYILLGLAGAFMAASIARMIFGDTMKMGTVGGVAAMATGAGLMIGMGALMKTAMTPPPLEIPTADLGMRMYDMGGKASLGGRHFPVMVEPGETIVSKTQNMMGGGGITLNIGGDIVTDNAEDFADRIAQVLPEALRRQSDIGGI